ncbi:ankyrin repeat domain-containing protein [Aspergillus tanneri]|uniref:Uncharacterized protein n=1 Tax=Aspergillus tanneri TaxID=1220188 RepID=A0A5M9MI71_9EURO|nr:uncharacterized protein ATNIH1004_009282 [Aspergillus tanneri]KAA8645070.1 hypothetical protein ATNIH1004_009282 [Aspergillus tanneri]
MYAIAASPSVATNPGCVAITWGRCQPSGIRLLRVSESGHEEVVRMLLEIGADANAVAAANETGMGAKQTSLRLLLEKGAHIHLKEEQMTTLDLATKTAHKDVAQLLLEEGEKQREPKETVLNLAAKKGHVEAVRLLLEKDTHDIPEGKQRQHCTGLQSIDARQWWSSCSRIVQKSIQRKRKGRATPSRKVMRRRTTTNENDSITLGRYEQA